MSGHLPATYLHATFPLPHCWRGARPLARVEQLVELKTRPQQALRRPWQYWRTPVDALHMLPKWVTGGPVMDDRIAVSDLPQLVSWPHDGGPFITLPMVYSEDVREPGLRRSNLGMYRVQLAGNQYQADREIGLHYQIHRSIGVHHAAAVRAGRPFRVNVFVGGPPAMAVAAVMPLPEGMSELGFAGVLGGRRTRMIRRAGELPIYADADFCITGVVEPDRLLPEGPFGDHLGYYSLAHPFPVMRVDAVYGRRDAIWPRPISVIRNWRSARLLIYWGSLRPRPSSARSSAGRALRRESFAAASGGQVKARWRRRPVPGCPARRLGIRVVLPGIHPWSCSLFTHFIFVVIAVMLSQWHDAMMTSL